MPADRDAREDDRLLFCPFCRECYEGRAECPEHELPLVDFSELPKQAHERQTFRWEDPVLPWEPRFGRAWIAAGAVACITGFFLPVVEGTFEDQPIEWTGMDLATGPGPNLWTVPFVGAMFLVFLYRRLTPLQMRGARLAAVLLSLMPAASLAYSLHNVQRGAAQAHGAMAVEWGLGAWVIAASTLLLLIGSLRFGAMPGGVGAARDAEALREAAAAEPGGRIDARAERPSKRRRRR